MDVGEMFNGTLHLPIVEYIAFSDLDGMFTKIDLTMCREIRI